MNKLALLSLAATAALVPAAVAAQQGTVDPPEKWEDTPKVSLRKPLPPAGVTKPLPPPVVRQAVPAPVVRATPPAPVVRRVETVRVRTAPPAAGHAPTAHHAAPGHHPPAHVGTHHGGHDDMEAKRERVVVRHGSGERVERLHIRRSAPHYSRVERGHRVDPYWMGPGHHVRDWNRYGFAQPYEDRRWIRYYDDALLIDRYGTVHDGRYGMDWDNYGERWHEDGRGAPVYGGDRDYYPDDDDYAYGEDHGDCDCDYDRGYGYPGGYPGGNGYYGYGYGYGYGGTVTVTETTVTTAPTVVETIRYEDVEVVTKHKAKKRHHKPKSKTLRYPGERG